MKKIQLNIEKIEKERKRLGWTYAELSRHAGITRQHLYQMIKRRSPCNVHLIAKALDLDPKDIIR